MSDGGLCGRQFEAVTDITDRLDELRATSIALDLGAQRGDTAIDTAVGHEHRIAPDAVEDGVAREGTAGALDEEREQLVLLAGELDLGVAAEELVRGGIEAEIAEPADGAGVAQPAERGLHAGEE